MLGGGILEGIPLHTLTHMDMVLVDFLLLSSPHQQDPPRHISQGLLLDIGGIIIHLSDIIHMIPQRISYRENF